MTARTITITPMRTPSRPAIVIEPVEMDGQDWWTVIVHDDLGQPRRRWFDCRVAAWAHGADMADKHSLPLLSLDGAAPEGEG